MFYIWSTLNYIFLLETLLFTKCKIFIYLFCFSSCLEIVNSLRKTRTNIIKFFTFKSSTSTNKNEKNEEIEQVDSTLKKEVFIKCYSFLINFSDFEQPAPLTSLYREFSLAAQKKRALESKLKIIRFLMILDSFCVYFYFIFCISKID